MRVRFTSNNQLTGGITYERSKWKCCFCCHVRTGTIFLGIWHLSLHMLSLAAIAVLALHPQTLNLKSGIPTVTSIENENNQDFLSVLPTPLSTEVHEEPQALPFSDINDQTSKYISPNTDASSKVLYGSFVYKDWFADRSTLSSSDQQPITYQDLNISIGVNFCTLGITVLMIYGAVRGKSLYLMPFFCLQAFDFFVTSLSVIGYLSYVPDIRQVLIKSPNIPLREELLSMDPQCLSLLILAGILLTLVVKVYFISIVWSCYKFLTLQPESTFERESTRGVVDGQNLLEVTSGVGSDLPDYATAVTDPRFAKKPIYPTQPPPYTAIVDLPTASVPSDLETINMLAGSAKP